MFCNKCGNPLPKEGAVCKFCNAAMSLEQVNTMQQEKKDQEFRPELKTEMYGQDSKIEYREDSKVTDNKLLGVLIIGGIVLFIIILAIILNS